MGLCDQSNYCYVFECDYIIKFLEKFKVHPITGQNVGVSDLIELNFHRNNDSVYHCPVTYKIFNQYSKIIANRKSGHVYSYDAYQQLNLKPNNFRDLLTDEIFDKSKDIVTIQDPEIAEKKWNVTDFHYVKNNLKLDDDEEKSNIRDVNESGVLKSSLEEFKLKEKQIESDFYKIVGGKGPEEVKEEKLDKINSAVYSDGILASSVTSTVAPVVTSQRAALLSEEQILYPRIKKKGYVQLVTNFGPINIELFCDRTPKTCHNFLLLASRGYYNDTIFHRLIKNFILQGGDPSGTGIGGQSYWGEAFHDECHADLKHEGKGVVAMANSGPNTNKSQFYITFKGNWSHLDGKHTVFGRVVGGLDTLERIEVEVEVDKNDRPKKEIKILAVNKYVDPFEEVEKLIEEERRDEHRRNGAAKRDAASATGVGPTKAAKKFRSGVGVYIDSEQLKSIKRASVEPGISKNDGEEQSEGLSAVPEEAAPASLSGKLAQLSQSKSKVQSRKLDFSNW